MGVLIWGHPCPWACCKGSQRELTENVKTPLQMNTALKELPPPPPQRKKRTSIAKVGLPSELFAVSGGLHFFQPAPFAGGLSLVKHLVWTMSKVKDLLLHALYHFPKGGRPKSCRLIEVDLPCSGFMLNCVSVSMANTTFFQSEVDTIA